jgi:hypothetical protein
MIDPSFWIDEKLGTCEPLARILFMGLISQADDEGRLNGHPALIKSLIFPYDHEVTTQNVEEWLILLAAAERRLILRYEVGHQKYIAIPNFKKHQTINKPQTSKLPAPLPDNYGIGTVTVEDNELTAPDQEKLIEEKVNEEEGKGKEAKLTEPSENLEDVKERLRVLIVECGLKGVGIDGLETIYTYIGQVETGVIERAIKKAEKKHVQYFVSIINGWIEEGKTTLELLNPIPQAGAPPSNYPSGTGNGQRNRTGKPSLPVVSDSGPSPTVTPEERAKMQELARRLRDGD